MQAPYRDSSPKMLGPKVPLLIFDPAAKTWPPPSCPLHVSSLNPSSARLPKRVPSVKDVWLPPKEHWVWKKSLKEYQVGKKLLSRLLVAPSCVNWGGEDALILSSSSIHSWPGLACKATTTLAPSSPQPIRLQSESWGWDLGQCQALPRPNWPLL